MAMVTRPLPARRRGEPRRSGRAKVEIWLLAGSGSKDSAGSRTQQQASDFLRLAASRRRCARGSPPCLLGLRSRGATTCHAEVCPREFFGSALVSALCDHSAKIPGGDQGGEGVR